MKTNERSTIIQRLIAVEIVGFIAALAACAYTEGDGWAVCWAIVNFLLLSLTIQTTIPPDSTEGTSLMSRRSGGF